ncbi:DUF167 domain-containing protein [bacterium]|nr:DUF167 domain-containing protein [bacterium]
MYKSFEDILNQLYQTGCITFKLKVTAGAKKENIEFLEDIIKLKISARPIEGKANKAIIGFFSDNLKIAKTKIKIVNGETSSVKTIKIEL